VKVNPHFGGMAGSVSPAGNQHEAGRRRSNRVRENIGWLDSLTPSLQSLLITNNYSAIANLLTSQITRTRSPFPSKGFLTGTITSNHYEVFLPFPATANSQHSPPILFRLLFCTPTTTASFEIYLSYNNFARTQRKTQFVFLTKPVYRPVVLQLTPYCCQALKREGV
jgi:hypothetical protein